MSHPNFPDLVRNSLSTSLTQGGNAFILLRKLRSLKASLKGWNKQVFDDFNFRIESFKVVVGNLDSVADLRDFFVEESRPKA